ncbi:MAG: acyl-CoA dehydrogenase family protein [Alphaproteobacteria bacterium]|nr:acyl-CoA dehydrogenase family protein [Alphaproteobacteria bacterium]MCB9793546.1 acyl-CoA dehydrogenase family protein [Alphaproteobacteria bacterium]
MIDLFLDDTHRALAEAAEAWVQREIRPHAEAWEEANLFPRELYRAAAEAGLIGATYPESLGGAGGDVFHGLVITEALIRGGSAGTAVGLGSHAIALPPILKLGTPEQQERFIPPVLRGEKIAALGVTEPGAGSDVAGIRCRAVRDGDVYRVSGTKTFITSGARADLILTAVRTGGAGHGGISLLVIERGTPGFTVGRSLRKMGWWASDTAELHFEDCPVPVANRIGPEHGGFYALMSNFVPERLMLACIAVSMARLALEESERYLTEREAFGRRLDRFQVLRHRLAEMASKEAGARAHVATVAERHRRGEDVVAEVAMAKNHATEVCSWVCDQAVQLHGGYGYMREVLVERLYRDARILPIGGGTTEIMREIISRMRGYGA